MRTNVYVDGFNLYYGCLRNSSYRWLNLEVLAQRLLPPNQIQHINYYTARVSARPHDPDQPVRQQTYLRALSTLPLVSITYGHFLTNRKRALLVTPPPGGSPFADVWASEEKGSDVNLAAHLVRDAMAGAFDVAMVITDDSDLAEPMRIAHDECQKQIVLISPRQRASYTLVRHADFVKPLRPSFLRASQLLPTLTDAKGTFSKPAGW